MNHKKGRLEIEILMLLITIVLTSGIIFLLVQSGVIKVKSSGEEQPILNTEFIPMGREGDLVIKEFQFCSYISETYDCLGKSNQFNPGDNVYFIFQVESSTNQGEIMVVKNYQIVSPDGNILLDVDEKNNFHFETSSSEKEEVITIKDFFNMGTDAAAGEYTLNLIIENPLLNKKVTVAHTFEITAAGEGGFEE